MTAQRLPPKEFNPTLFFDRCGEVWRVRVECWNGEVARVEFDPDKKPCRDWSRVVQRWARLVIRREYQRWLEGGNA